MSCRKSFTELTVDERNWLGDALNALYADGSIHEHAHHHEEYFSNGIHRGPAFLPWHRHMMLLFEGALRAVDARLTLPYWDWTRADSRDLDIEPWKSFFGGRNNTGGKFDHWDYTRASAPIGSLPSLDSVINELQAATFADFRAMEFGSHVPAHTWTGETMASTASPHDPLFYLHHCNVDRLWAIWQRNHSGVVQYTLDNCADCDTIAATFVPLNDPMVGGATPASMLDHTALGYFYGRDDALESRALELGLPPIISGDVTDVVLETPQVVFNDVPEGDTTKRAALFHVSGCESLTFRIANAPSPPFSLFAPGPFPFPGGPLHTDELRIWVMYTGRSPAGVDAGTMSVVAENAFGDEVERWDNIPIFANSVPRPKVAVALVLDESGSMLYGAGNNRTRLEVLRLAATTFVDQLYDDNGLAMAAFANTAEELKDLEAVGPLDSAVRNDARTKIAAHGPPDVYQHTSIGAGLQTAADIYNTSPIAAGYEIKTTVVFTDGFEDRAPLIAEVRPLINERVYAVGVADAANVRNDILRAVADESGGFMLVTGAIAQDDEFLLEKFFIQILAGVTNRDIVRDPDGWLVPGQVSRVPFSITRSDVAFDAVALSRAANYVAIALQTPDMTVVGPGQVPAGQFRLGLTSGSYRITLPLVADGKEHWEGEWQLLLALRLGRDFGKIAAFGPTTTALSQSAALRFHALVHARSNLRLRASVAQSALTPGAEIRLRAVITEYGQPIETRPQVTATMTRPDQTTAQLSFGESAPGEFDTSTIAGQAGVYRFHVQASGVSSRGQAFTREHLLSAVVGLPPRDPTGPTTDGGREIVCEFLKCLSAQGVIDERLIRRLEALGINVRQLGRCLEQICRSSTERRDHPIR
jgi:hypothetical protein